MIGFSLTEEQEDLRRLAHRFAEDEVRPVAPTCDEKEEMPWETLKKAHALGLHSYHYATEYGGGGAESLVTEVVVAEELAWGCAGFNTALGGTGLAMIPLTVMGTHEQKKKFLSHVCSSDLHLAAMCLTEPNAGSDVVSMQTTAKRDGDDYVINGLKCFITNGGVADVHVVYATLDRNAGYKGITAFLVDKDTPGVRQGKKEKKMGIRSSHTAEVVFEDARVPIAHRLGEEGQGWLLAMKMLELSRPGVGAAAVGIGRAAYEFARDYAKERVQFGKPIAKQQAIGFMLADMAMNVDAARLLVWRAAALADAGKGCNLEGSMAKCFAGDTAMKVTTDAVQILGGYGYMREYPVEKWMRDAKIMQIYEGTNQIQRVVISGMITS